MIILMILVNLFSPESQLAQTLTANDFVSVQKKGSFPISKKIAAVLHTDKFGNRHTHTHPHPHSNLDSSEYTTFQIIKQIVFK